MPSSTLTAAAPAAVGATLNALAEVLGADHDCVPAAVTVETQRARRERLDAAARQRDLLGVSEIAALFGVVRQSAHRSTQLASFPEPLTRLATGPVWLRGDVEQWRGRRDLQPTSATSRRPTPGQRHRTDLARLIVEAAAGGADIDPAVVALTRRGPHYLTGSALATAVAGLGGAAAVAEQLGVTPRTVQRWTSTTHDRITAAGCVPRSPSPAPGGCCGPRSPPVTAVPAAAGSTWPPPPPAWASAPAPCSAGCTVIPPGRPCRPAASTTSSPRSARRSAPAPGNGSTSTTLSRACAGCGSAAARQPRPVRQHRLAPPAHRRHP